MRDLNKIALGAVIAVGLGAGSAWADGSYTLYTIGNSVKAGEIHIQNDVQVDGETYSMWSVPQTKMLLYISPDAAYVTMDANSPVIGKPFGGGWVSTKSTRELRGAKCDEPVTDHAGVERPYWGTLTWTITSLSTTYDFEIKLGTCGGPEKPWAQSVDAKG